MSTPEGKVKAKVKDVLKKHGAYSFMPVQTGYGDKTLDFLCCVNGHFIGIETKAPGKRPGPLQDFAIRRIRAAGGHTFVIDGTPDTTTYEELDTFLCNLSR
jgi:hypothetical protein